MQAHALPAVCGSAAKAAVVCGELGHCSASDEQPGLLAGTGSPAAGAVSSALMGSTTTAYEGQQDGGDATRQPTEPGANNNGGGSPSHGVPAVSDGVAPAMHDGGSPEACMHGEELAKHREVPDYGMADTTHTQPEDPLRSPSPEYGGEDDAMDADDSPEQAEADLLEVGMVVYVDSAVDKGVQVCLPMPDDYPKAQQLRAAGSRKRRADWDAGMDPMHLLALAAAEQPSESQLPNSPPGLWGSPPPGDGDPPPHSGPTHVNSYASLASLGAGVGGRDGSVGAYEEYSGGGGMMGTHPAGMEGAGVQKRSRLAWTPELHAKFVKVVETLGQHRAVPKSILQLMKVPGLTREQVASHLQKYRLHLKKGGSGTMGHDLPPWRGSDGGGGGGGGGGVRPYLGERDAHVSRRNLAWPPSGRRTVSPSPPQPSAAPRATSQRVVTRVDLGDVSPVVKAEPQQGGEGTGAVPARTAAPNSLSAEVQSILAALSAQQQQQHAGGRASGAGYGKPAPSKLSAPPPLQYGGSHESDPASSPVLASSSAQPAPPPAASQGAMDASPRARTTWSAGALLPPAPAPTTQPAASQQVAAPQGSGSGAAAVDGRTPEAAAAAAAAGGSYGGGAHATAHTTQQPRLSGQQLVATSVPTDAALTVGHLTSAGVQQQAVLQATQPRPSWGDAHAPRPSVGAAPTGTPAGSHGAAPSPTLHVAQRQQMTPQQPQQPQPMHLSPLQTTQPAVSPQQPSTTMVAMQAEQQQQQPMALPTSWGGAPPGYRMVMWQPAPQTGGPVTSPPGQAQMMTVHGAGPAPGPQSGGGGMPHLQHPQPQQQPPVVSQMPAYQYVEAAPPSQTVTYMPSPAPYNPPLTQMILNGRPVYVMQQQPPSGLPQVMSGHHHQQMVMAPSHGGMYTHGQRLVSANPGGSSGGGGGLMMQAPPGAPMQVLQAGAVPVPGSLPSQQVVYMTAPAQ